MTLTKILQLISLALLLYLLAENFLHVDFAATKNDYLTSMNKSVIDSTQNVDTLKNKAKAYIDTIRKIHREYSAKSLISFWLVAVLIVIQVVLFKMDQRIKAKQ